MAQLRERRRLQMKAEWEAKRWVHAPLVAFRCSLRAVARCDRRKRTGRSGQGAQTCAYEPRGQARVFRHELLLPGRGPLAANAG